MTAMRKAPEPVDAEVREWLAGWGAQVATQRFVEARDRFDGDVIGFGTKEAAARGLDALEADQWRSVWPKIEGFAFDAAAADVWVSPDGLMAVIAAGWMSTAHDPDGSSRRRPGRATAVLQRDSMDAPWEGVHTHFSLVPTDPGT